MDTLKECGQLAFEREQLVRLDRAGTCTAKRELLDIANAREQILAIAQRTVIPLGEQVKGATRPKLDTAKVAVQFRHPDDSTKDWAGRGRQPKWVKAWAADGKSIDGLKI